MKGRRTQYEIYWEILVFCREQRTFTSIINRCDMNSKKGQEYLKFLLGKKYLVVEGERKLYMTTAAGREYISLFNGLYQELFNERPGFKLS
ncbi:MAG: hypothetical protein KAV87_45725 [Desulfobacteraceae bacterium]|nr:hypothetical protein [Desulfobacteraceae bacterium]